MDIETEYTRLLKTREQISNGDLTSIGFEEIINSTKNSASGLKVNNVDMQLVKELAKVENALGEALSKYTANSSIVKGLKDKLGKIKPLLKEKHLEAVNAAINSNRERLNSIIKQKELTNNKFLEKPNLIKRYNELQQKLEISERNLTSLYSVREQFQLEMAQNNVPWKIIKDPFVFEKPISPDLTKNFIAAILLGLLMAIIASLIREETDNVFHSPKEVEDELKLPILGHLPHISVLKNLRKEKQKPIQISRVVR